MVLREPLGGRGRAYPRRPLPLVTVQRIERAVIVLACLAALGFGVVALRASQDAEPQTGPAAETRTVTVYVEAPAKAAPRLPAPRAEGGRREVEYVVRVGDTLWSIAARNYDDVVAGMRTIKRRNGLKREKVLAGEVLVLPAVERPASG
jgi:nucleoid-associated protein YgaU